MRLAIDTGGTFTDLIGLDDDGNLVSAKAPSDPLRPANAVVAAIEAAGIDPTHWEELSIGTTVATNTVLERDGAQIVLVMTEGFGDVPFIGRINKERLYDLNWNKPSPLVSRQNVVECPGRIGPKGTVLSGLEEDQLGRVAAAVAERVLSQEGPVGVAICLLHSYANPIHESLLVRALRKLLPPEVGISASHQVSPMWREFERSSTTIADAYVLPSVQKYIDSLSSHPVIAAGFRQLSMMRSNGGRLSVASARERPVELLLSGPAGGALSGAYFAGLSAVSEAITLDMGGTSTDIGAVLGGSPLYREEFDIEWGIPAAIPAVDVRTIGSGGGSIIWVDSGGLLRVGPRSAGSVPGPACYGTGGHLPTITDANVVLGRLSAQNFLGGSLDIHPELAYGAFTPLVNESEFSSVEELAEAAVNVACENIANAVRLIAVEKGLDLEEFAIVAFGGAGGLHAPSVAKALGVRTVIVPTYPAAASAFGILMADARVDRVATIHRFLEETDVKQLIDLCERLEEDALADLRGEGHDVVFEYALAMRYHGQNYEREVALPGRPDSRASIDASGPLFHEAHNQLFGFSSEGHRVEVVSLRVTGVVPAIRPRLPTINEGDQPPIPREYRPVFFSIGGWRDVPVFRRGDLLCGHDQVKGPAIVEEDASTVLIEEGNSLSVSSEGSLQIAVPAKFHENTTVHPLARRPSPAAIRPEDNEVETMVVVHNALANIADEMALVMLRTSYSTIFNEGLDFSTMLFDRKGNLIAEKCYTPSMIGAMPNTLKWALDELGEEYFEEGDVVVHNDPYRGNCHLPEHMMIKPIFYGGELFGFAGVMGHVSEIGGMAVGSFASQATDIYQEGLRLPPIKLLKRGKHVDDIWRVILTNHRTPRYTWGDFHAMIGALNVGERRVQDVLSNRGRTGLSATVESLRSYSETRMRAAIKELADGDYYAYSYLEDDGLGTTDILFQVVIRIRNDEVFADWRGSAPQVKGPMNCTYVVTQAAVFNAVFSIVDPLSDIPRNHGCYAPIHTIAPPGTVVNVRHPGSEVSGNTEQQAKLIDTLLAALLPVAPERVSAAAGGTPANFLFGGRHEDGEFFSVYLVNGAGTGATALNDGNNAEITRHSNCRNTPVEVLEARYPWHVKEYRLIPDSGGAGEHRGGLGLVMTLEALQPMMVSAVFDRMRYAPWGLNGGLPGRKTKVLLRRRGSSEFRLFTEAAGTQSPTKFANVEIEPGDQVRFETPGGGGFGRPTARSKSRIAADLAEGWISAEAGKELYGAGHSVSAEVDSEFR